MTVRDPRNSRIPARWSIPPNEKRVHRSCRIRRTFPPRRGNLDIPRTARLVARTHSGRTLRSARNDRHNAVASQHLGHHARTFEVCSEAAEPVKHLYPALLGQQPLSQSVGSGQPIGRLLPSHPHRDSRTGTSAFQVAQHGYPQARVMSRSPDGTFAASGSCRAV